jgi:hypothetical protein
MEVCFMRFLSFTFALSLAVVAAMPALAQNQGSSVQSGAANKSKVQASPGQAAMDKASESGKYAFVLFWKENNDQTQKVSKTLQSGLTKFADSAESITLQLNDPAEKVIVDRYNVSKAPMPLILAIGPSGAVTKAFPGKLDEKQLASAFVSPCEELCMKAIQNRRLVFVCVAYDVPADGKATIPQGVKDFQTDKRFSEATEIVLLNAADEKEASFLKELKVDTKSKNPVSVLLAPGALIGTFDAAAGKDIIVEKLAAASSGGCAGGKCGPGGCGPKK